MKQLKLNFDKSGLILDEVDKQKSPEELSVAIIKNVILAYGQHQKGISEEDRLKFYKISDAFDKAIKDKSEEVELEDDWIGFVKKCFREAPLLPSPLLRVVEENLRAIQNR